jgi:acetyl-CoA C-acetyltransferase
MAELNALIFDAVRTPRGKGSAKGALHGVKPIDLLKPLYDTLRVRLPLDSTGIDDVVLGVSSVTGEQGANLARISALYAGLGERVPGITVSRFCCSGLDAVNLAAAKVTAGENLVLAGGVESMSRVSMFADQGAWFADPEVAERTGFVFTGIAADIVATMEGYTRAELDAYAVQSHARAAAAIAARRFDASLVAISSGDGQVRLAADECVRAGTTAETLATLPPAFAAEGAKGQDARALARLPHLGEIRHLHHVGNSPAMADGAALVAVGGPELERAGFRPRGRILAYANVASDPVVMLTGAVEATRRAVAAARLSLSDIDLFEVQEPFAAPMLHYSRSLGVDLDRINVNGGTIALGHALGATGGVLVGMLLDELARRRRTYGVAAIVGGAGLAVATVIEAVGPQA